MLFNSLEFAIFLPIIFILYWFVFNKKLKLQNLFLLISSYIFYGWWDYRFLLLILFSTVVDFTIGLSIKEQKKETLKIKLLWLSIILNIGLLFFFKYYNFFIESFTQSFSFFGSSIGIHPLSIILPVGISFYTFQTLSYTIDVYRNKIEPTKDFIAFASFVTFFPQLVAGPIERAVHLLPQFYKNRIFNYEKSVSGIRLILWGFFQKVVIADTCASYVNLIFENYKEYSSITLILGSVLFSFQIYGDFAGYSNIAIGVSRLFGFDLMRNFNYPYFSRDIAEFWRRWHISLSTWFRDYLYIPLGGSRGSMKNKIRNVFIIFLISGFWHGADWTFIAWGGLHALFFLPSLLLNKNRKHLNTLVVPIKFSSFKIIFKILTTFCLVTFAWIFFRSESITTALNYIHNIFINSNKMEYLIPYVHGQSILLLFIYLMFFILMEWLNLDEEHFVNKYLSSHRLIRYATYALLVLLIIINIKNEASSFIYFQF